MTGSDYSRIYRCAAVDFAAIDLNGNSKSISIACVAITDCRTASGQIARPSILVRHIQIQLAAVDRNLFRTVACTADQSARAVRRTVDLAAVDGNRAGNLARICANACAVCGSAQIKVQRTVSFYRQAAILRYINQRL